LSHEILGAPVTDVDVTEIELADETQKKRNRLPPRLDQGQHDRRIDNTKRNPGNPCSSTDINYPEPWTPGQHRPEEQGVEEETPANAGDCAETGQIVSSVPLEKEIGVTLESRTFLVGGGPLEQGWKRVEERPEALSTLSGHYDPTQAFLLATRPVVRWVELPRSM